METVEDLYTKYLENPEPNNLNKVVNGLAPTINYTLSSMGISNNPTMKNKAKSIVAKSIMKYDPNSGTQLKTWATQQLQELKRIKRDTEAVTRIPEMVQIEGWKLHQAEQEFIDHHDREPDVLELADRTNLSVKRIEKIRSYLKQAPSESAVVEAAGDITGGAFADFQGEAFEYIYNDADYVDRKILEHKTGYGGAAPIDGVTLAAKLKLSPVQLSRRSARLALKIQEIEEALQEVQ